MPLRRSFAWYPNVFVFPQQVCPKCDLKQKERAGLWLTCVAGHSGAHVMESGLKWQNTDVLGSV